MKFEEAFPLVRQGKHIRRRGSKETVFLMAGMAGIRIYIGEGTSSRYWKANQADILADDWEYVEGKE